MQVLKVNDFILYLKLLEANQKKVHIGNLHGA